MVQAGAAASRAKKKSGKRTSGRTTVLSKAMGKVDEETRLEVRDARLEALEADNYVGNVEEEPDEEYVDSEDGNRPTAKREAKRRRNAAPKSGQASKLISSFRKKSVAQWVYEAGYNPSDGPNYLTAAAKPSRLPTRHFCSVCGYWGLYACTRCGMRYCCGKCAETHKETRCLKFATG
ncbi:zinc finger hit domain-containing protein 1 [Nannochloropsis oceanica]